MANEINSTKNKVCPVCGSKVSENASRCLVCGTSLESGSGKNLKKSEIKSPRTPSITLNLPLAIGLVIIFLAIGAGAVYAVLNQSGMVVEPTPTVTASVTPTVTPSPTVTLTPTLQPTMTPLPDIEYKI